MRQWLQKIAPLFGQASNKTRRTNTGPNDGHRRRETSGEILIYLHMAKTGGATLGDILNRQFPHDAIVLPGEIEVASALGLLPHQQVVQRFKGIPQQQWSTARLVPGHFKFGVHEGIPIPASYLTMLRHPVSRVISSYYYILEQPGIPVREKIVSANLDLAGYVKSGLGLDPHNYQTRVLAGLPEYDSTWDDTSNVLKRGLPRGALELAQRNIENHIPYIGITERFDEFLLLLKLEFDWPLERILYRRINETHSKPSSNNLPEETIRLIEAHNQLDLELYAFAIKRFEEWLNLHAKSIDYLLPRFKEINRCYQQSNPNDVTTRDDIIARTNRIDDDTPGRVS